MANSDDEFVTREALDRMIPQVKDDYDRGELQRALSSPPSSDLDILAAANAYLKLQTTERQDMISKIRSNSPSLEQPFFLGMSIEHVRMLYKAFELHE